MTKIVLPRVNQTGANEWGDVESNDIAIRDVVNGELDHENLKSAAEIGRSQLAPEARSIRGKWYTPKVIATEETRTNTEFGFLTTEDKIEGVELAENGLMMIGYMALWKDSVASDGKAAIFIGSNQLKSLRASSSEATVQEASATSGFTLLGTYGLGLKAEVANTFLSTIPTTGMALGPNTESGVCYVFAAAGTYTVGVKFKATSGSVTAKERKLWVATLG